MLEKIKYINHINEIVVIGEGKIFANASDLHDFAWSVSSKNNKISAFKRGIVTKTIPLQIVCDSEEEGIRIKNSMYEIMEKDVLAKEYGRIVIGNYYMKCYVAGSKKSEYLLNRGVMQVSLSVRTDCPEWVKESTTSFNENTASMDEYLDFPFDYSYDYRNELAQKQINNTSFVASDFRMDIFGYSINPTIYIAGHEYSVECTIDTGEYLTIDSTRKTIVLTHVDGRKENLFNKRNKASYIFEKIPAGVSAITTTDSQIAFDITLMEERSEPKWT